MTNILKVLLVLIAVLIFIFLIVNFSRVKYFFERQGFADEHSDYIRPIILENILTEKQNREILEYANPRFYKCKFPNMFRQTISMDEVRNSQHTFIPKDNIIVKDLIEKLKIKKSVYNNKIDLHELKKNYDTNYNTIIQKIEKVSIYLKELI